jgi:hypothetical protein
MLVKVKDRKTGNERTVTQKAYAAMGPKVYEKLGFVNDDGSEISGSPNSKTPQVSRSVKSAAPVVVVKSQLVQPDATGLKNEPDEQSGKIKSKPGRKPGSSKKSISSPIDEVENETEGLSNEA